MSISVDMMIESTCQHTPTFAGILCHSKHKGGKVKKPGLVVQGGKVNFPQRLLLSGQEPCLGRCQASWTAKI
jgi:hypothetical protein